MEESNKDKKNENDKYYNESHQHLKPHGTD